MSKTVGEIFSDYQADLNAEHDLKEVVRSKVRDIDRVLSELVMILQRIHSEDGIKHIADICKLAHDQYSNLTPHMTALKESIPDNQYYRFHVFWQYPFQRLVFILTLVVYLEEEKLASIQDVASMLGVTVKEQEGFHLDLEDYLCGVLMLASELARFSRNSVTAGDYVRPVQISKFVNDLSAAYRLLNLKNDTLRRKFDGLKYDLKKIEEVVYDLSIRGLRPKEDDEAADAAKTEGKEEKEHFVDAEEEKKETAMEDEA